MKDIENNVSELYPCIFRNNDAIVYETRAKDRTGIILSVIACANIGILIKAM